MRREETLFTERLRMEPLEEWHGVLFYPLLCDPPLYTFVPGEPPASVDEVIGRFQRWSQGRSPDGKEQWLNWGLRTQSPSREHVGTVQATIGQAGVATIAYMVFPQHARQGFATEAVREMLHFLFDACGVNVAEAYIDTRNRNSIRLVEALGFNRSELIPNADFFKGNRSDEYRYTLARPML